MRKAPRPARERASGAWSLEAIEVAIARRREQARPPGTNLLRLVDDVGDDCAGLVVDRYGDIVRVEAHAQQWPGQRTGVVELLARQQGVRGIVGVLRTAAGRYDVQALWGDVPAQHVVHEDGLRFLVRTCDPSAVGSGVFVDQRIGRRLVRDAARGRVVMNLFAHAGAFGVAAAVGGAARVDHVDAARKCAPWAALNLALNGVDSRAHRFLVDDALKVLQRASKKPGSIDVLVCDPPTQAVRPDGSHFVLRDSLVELSQQATSALSDGGALLLSCNDRDVDVNEIADRARAGARQAARSVRDVVEVPLPDDVRSRVDARARPMRGVWLTLR